MPTTGTIVSSSKNITLIQSKSCSFSTFFVHFLNNFSETSFSRFATEIVVWSFHTTSSLRSQLLLQIKIQQVPLSEDYEKTYEKFITLHWCQLLFYISPLRLDIFWIRNSIGCQESRVNLTNRSIHTVAKGERAGRCKYTQFLPVQLSHTGIRRYWLVSFNISLAFFDMIWPPEGLKPFGVPVVPVIGAGDAI